MKEIKKYWKGRIDGTLIEQLRWHQRVQFMEKNNDLKKKFVIIGFCCDEGIKRNNGRMGAKEAPNVLRQTCSNFPLLNSTQVIYDAGNIYCDNGNLELAQENLSIGVHNVFKQNGKSMVWGGGHEVTFAHYLGIKRAFPNKKIGIVNIDAHFDNRKIDPKIGATSGTGFFQIAELEPIYSLTIGIQKNSNTQALFEYANNKGMQYILAEELDYINLEKIQTQINSFISQIEVLYLTVCMDVFSSAFAPGVSATAYNGVSPDKIFKNIFSNIITSPKLMAFDVAEVNPSLDKDLRTAKLASSLIFEVINT